MIIAKFGGSSVGSPERLLKVAELVERHPEYRGVAVSAYQGVTNDLLAMSARAAARDATYKDLLAKLESRHLDAATSLLPAKTQTKALVSLRLWLNELADALHKGIAVAPEPCLEEGVREPEVVVQVASEMGAGPVNGVEAAHE